MKRKKLIVIIGTILLLCLGYFIADTILYDGAKSKPVRQDGFVATFFAKKNLENKAAVILIGGGQWGDYWANEIAKRDMVGLSLPYIGDKDLPRLPEEIELEYFAKAINWLSKQKEVDQNKIVVMGASRNAELALIIACIFPEMVSGAIAYAPSSVSWANTVLPYNSNDIKASWKYQDKDIPYIPMEKLKGGESYRIDMLDYWQKGLEKTEVIEQASIKVEEIKGPVLLLSGIDDRVWPSATMADQIENRLRASQFKYTIQNIKYENAGHLISTAPKLELSSRIGVINIDGKDYEYLYGGTNEGDYKAKQDAKIKLMEFLKQL
ncbi:MAG: acyl-CoA thioester hydrolase/BAAT C-terminal domain-containing protein [Bacteroidota bacterium]